MAKLIGSLGARISFCDGRPFEPLTRKFSVRRGAPPFCLVCGASGFSGLPRTSRRSVKNCTDEEQFSRENDALSHPLS